MSMETPEDEVVTVDEIRRYFSDRSFLPDPDQEVQFVLADEDVPIEKGQRLEMRGTTVPEKGKVVVALRPAKKFKYMFSLKFEANPVIEAHTVEEAEAKAYAMMRGVGVTRQATSGIFEDMPEYVAQEPLFLEEVE